MPNNDTDEAWAESQMFEMFGYKTSKGDWMMNSMYFEKAARLKSAILERLRMARQSEATKYKAVGDKWLKDHPPTWIKVPSDQYYFEIGYALVKQLESE